EAFRALESLGLIEIRPGEGTFVHEVSVESLIQPLALVMASGREAIGELFEARRLLEPIIAGLAATRATRDGVQEKERILEPQAMLDHLVAVEGLVLGTASRRRSPPRRPSTD